jgi:hypothetical protein
MLPFFSQGAMNEHQILFKLGKTSVETHEILQTVSGDEALCCISVGEWFKQFKGRHEDL